MNDSPDRRRVPLRALVRFLALFLVPVVVVAGPNVAEAATVYGDGVNFSVELSDPTSDSMNCVGVGQWVVPDSTALLDPYVKFANLKCPLTFALGNQTSCDADDCSEVVVEVEGEGCSASGSATIIAGSSDWATFAGPSLTLDPLCDVSSLCLTFNGYANNMPDMGTGRGCVGWPLGVAPAKAPTVPTGCTGGGPSATPTATWSVSGSDYTLTTTVPMAAQTASKGWYVTPIFEHTTGVWQGEPKFDAYSTITRAAGPAGNMVVSRTQHYIQLGGSHATAQAFQTRLRGVMVYATDRAATAYPGWTSPPYIAITRAVNTGVTPGSDVGWTHGPSCLWYFGPKIRTTDTHGRDVPAGALNAPAQQTGTPVADDAAAAPPASDTVDESCAAGFSIWKPGTWVSAGYCEIVSGLSTVARGVLAIPRAILGGLGGLFVPVDAPSWSDVPSPLPGGWVPSFDSLPVGGCAPLTMPQLDLGYAGSVGPTQMFDTCDDPWPLVRTFTYNGLLAMVLVGAIWQAYRAVATALGMNVQGGGGGGDDE